MKQDGGPAYPYPETGEKGMSLRDYFAGQALIQLIRDKRYSTWDDLALDCYEAAGAMIRIRSEED